MSVENDLDGDHSELPKVWVSLEHGPMEDETVYAYEGQYVPDGVLPFDVDDSAGVHFEMDGVVCELLGDLGGHAVYRRRRNESALYTMPWDDFAQAMYEDIIDIID